MVYSNHRPFASPEIELEREELKKLMWGLTQAFTLGSQVKPLFSSRYVNLEISDVHISPSNTWR